MMKKNKTENFNLPTTAASRHTTPAPGYFLSSRFICEATIHLSSRFYYEATGHLRFQIANFSISDLRSFEVSQSWLRKDEFRIVV